jgi:hypothetical protein
MEGVRERGVRRIFGPNERGSSMMGKNNWELHNFYSSPSIIRGIKPRRLSCLGHKKCVQDISRKA